MEYFEIKEEHLKLIQHSYVSWDDCEFGAASINCKRPYGNSDVISDIAEILNIKPVRYDESYDELVFSNEQIDAMRKLHEEIETVLQICFVTLKFEIGFFEKIEEYNSHSWRKVKNANLDLLKKFDTSKSRIDKEDFKPLI